LLFENACLNQESSIVRTQPGAFGNHPLLGEPVPQDGRRNWNLFH